MSRISDLKDDPRNSINIINVLELVCPHGKSKYVETLLRIVKSTTKLPQIREIVIKELSDKFNISKTDLLNYTDLEVIYFKLFLECFNMNDMKMYQNFCDLNERSLISNSDLSTYNLFGQIENAVKEAQFKVEEKELEKQVVKLLDNDDWVVLKPLTHRASLKYGANTTWCTASKNDPDTFEKYSNGILIYVINKKTGLKVAAYKSLDVDDVSFFDSQDKKKDSLFMGLPMDVLSIIKHNMDTSAIPNKKTKVK